LKESKESLDRALESAVSRALRDNLIPLQRTADELHQAYADLVSACASSRPGNALPAVVRAQTSAAALAAGLNVLANFVTSALNHQELAASISMIRASAVAEVEEESPAAAKNEQVAVESIDAPPVKPTPEPEETYAAKTDTAALLEESIPQAVVEEPGFVEAAVETATVAHEAVIEEPAPQSVPEPVAAQEVELDPHVPAPKPPVADRKAAEAPLFDVAGFIASLPVDQQDLHRRANRVAKVTMQDIKLLKPGDVQNGREQNDICVRLRSDLDKARREYDRRFRAILDHPVDYFHYWLVEILAEGRGEALGEYPYPSPVLRR
jgi:hypothetical protein